MTTLPAYKHCFVCGITNDSGLQVIWKKTNNGVEGIYTGQKKHCSYAGILHGGVIASLLDECIGWAVSQNEKKMHVTGELTISYKASVPTGKTLTISGFISEEQENEKKYRNGHGNITDSDGTVYATAKGIFFPIPDAQTESILSMLTHHDSNEKVTSNDIWK